MNHYSCTTHKQKGMTLLVALVTLIVLMLLGLGAMQTSSVSSRLAGNLQYQNEAKNQAENALAKAESLLLSGTTSQNTAFLTANAATSAAPYYDPTATLSPLTSWPAAASSVNANSQFFIQQISPVKVCPPGQNCLALGGQSTTPATQYYLFRLTAKGSTVRGATRLVESIVQVPTL